ncbi:hypothetical protein DGG96_09390 [Legionella qingyii]|uniref:Uncharacterized protein n=1 Tax=Legionella qingyii TaxID=2184757 RepID=A0A317U3U7_9GAMM|nr:hypothetical protein DGG96_09390 [Legionella qingyii]
MSKIRGINEITKVIQIPSVFMNANDNKRLEGEMKKKHGTDDANHSLSWFFQKTTETKIMVIGMEMNKNLHLEIYNGTFQMVNRE